MATMATATARTTTTARIPTTTTTTRKVTARTRARATARRGQRRRQRAPAARAALFGNWAGYARGVGGDEAANHTRQKQGGGHKGVFYYVKALAFNQTSRCFI